MSGSKINGTMLHRLKLRLLYAAALDKDKDARKRKIRAIFLAGLYTYPPFFAIAYFIAFETKAISIVFIGICSAITCIPVVFYAYAKGFGTPFLTLFQERRKEFLWLAIKIGFIYPFFLYFMILGFVEFFMGYGVVRAAMISFVATAVARDGFEIGYYRARSERKTISTFPDGESILPYLKSIPLNTLLMGTVFICIGGGIGFFLGSYFDKPTHQTLLTGVVAGIMGTIVYRPSSLKMRAQFFLWPAFTMAVTYFLALAYISKMILKIPLTPPVELAILMALSSTWLILELQFVWCLKWKMAG